MKRLIVTMVVMVAVLALGASQLMALNPRVSSSAASQLHNYSFLAKKEFKENDATRVEKVAAPTALGAYAADGGSPGSIITRTWRDDQNHGNPGRFVDWRGTAQIHFIFANQVCGGHTNPDACPRWLHYNMFDPSTAPGGVFVNGASGIPIQSAPLIEGGLYPNMDVDLNGRIVSIGEALTSPDAANAVRWVKLWWDAGPPNPPGTFISDSLPDQITGTGEVNFHYPVVEFQEYNGMYYTHVLALNGTGTTWADAMQVTHWRKENSTIPGLGGTWVSNLIVDGPWTDAYDMAVSRDNSGKVAIAWLRARSDAADWGSSINVITSDDAGATWTTVGDIVPFTQGVPSWQPWQECSLLYDSDNFLHIVYNTQEYDGNSATSIDPARIFHWTNRVAGPNAGGTTSSVDLLDFHGLNDIECAGSSNILNNGKVSIAECNGRLYTIWLAYGNADFPDDCAADTMSDGFRGAVNADIYMNVSLSLDGALWDFRRDLTNSHTPGCDGTDADPCDHDAFPAVSRYGMDVASMGTTYWSAAPEAFAVRDALDNAYPDDGYYLDVQFTNDIVADVARYMDTQHWSNNPIKWFRLPCVPPVIEPRILISSDPLLHPASWVKQGTQLDFDITVENIGNDELTISSITGATVQGSGWLQVNTGSLVIPAADSTVATITLNPGGAITTVGTEAYAIEGYVIFNSNDPNHPVDSFYISTVIADDVIQIAEETIHTGLGVPLIMGNHGAFGGVGVGGNLQFYIDTIGAIDEDCDSQLVYLYDGCPIIMYDAATYFWNNYYDVTDPDPAVNFVPVPGGVLAESGSTSDYEQYTTGEFVTADSSVGMIKTWVAPSTNVSYMVEKWQIYSWDGAAHNGVNVAEWVDMDVPSDTGANNFGHLGTDYIYVTGQETDVTGCTPSDGRAYITGLLGYCWQSEYDVDTSVNHTGLEGAYVGPAEDLMDGNNVFIPDSVWAFLGLNDFAVNNTLIDDKRSLLDFGTFDIPANDTLVIYILHGSLIGSPNVNIDLTLMFGNARTWTLDNRSGFGTFGCCGLYTGGYPGNTDCDTLGKRNLADITKLIDRVYISKAALCCEDNGNVDGDTLKKLNLADITKLIDLVYISKAEVNPCL
jgi:hypothetical protein